MVNPSDWTLTGHAGTLAARTWPNPTASWLAVLAHGYGEHIGRYQHVADALVNAGAVVVGHDHQGHGNSAGERALIPDFEPVVEDEHLVLTEARSANPSLPTVLIGHSMGGMIAARYAQRYPKDLAALVLSGPILGNWSGLDLLELDEIPDEPINPATLSRNPAVGAAYVADPLVWHGPLRRQTLLALDECLHTIDFDHPLGDDLPALWLHGDEDELVPMVDTRTGMDRIRGLRFEEIIYPGARHEVFNETNSVRVLADLTDFVHRTVLIGH
jgi:alpha-beta hydrolase superfamily lysophospholipase